VVKISWRRQRASSAPSITGSAERLWIRVDVLDDMCHCVLAAATDAYN